MRITIRVSSRESLSVVPSRGAGNPCPFISKSRPTDYWFFLSQGQPLFFCLSWFVSWELGLVTTSLEESQRWLDKNVCWTLLALRALPNCCQPSGKLPKSFFFFFWPSWGRVSEFWKSNIFWTLFGDTFLAHGFSILPEIISFCPCWKLTRYLKGFFKK